MYFFGLSKEEVLSQKHVVSYKEGTCKQNPINMVTLFGRQVYQVKSESSMSSDGYKRFNSPKLLTKDIDLQRPADHYAYMNFHETLGSGKFYGIGGSRNTVELGYHSGIEANNVKEATATNWSGKRNPRIVIDLEEPPPPSWVSETEKTEHVAASVSYVTMRNPETKPSFFDRISSNILKAVDQSLLVEDVSDKTSNEEEPSLLDLNSAPVDESAVSEPHYCFLQDLNCPYIEETETSCEKSGIDDGPTPLCSPQCQNVHEKDGTASPASYTSCCTTENNSRTESRRSSSPRALEPSCRTRLEFPVTEEDLQEENGCCNEEEDSSEVIQMAAESLVHISEISYQNQDLQLKLVSRTNSLSQDQDFSDKPEMGKAEPGCSCDSYERHTLGISETNTEEDFCVSSMALDELNNNITRDNNKEIGLKLRRGSRMKNFQKEILPCLTSLSRHEIREDINILEAVLRSREYKKMQGKTKDVKFGANAKNKRSAPQRCVGKRRRNTE
ncbi:PREDICTED: uncharacterized protein LOC104739863 [Camelina sativa]|uniref:Uncharacterized protein LOC104739863 n=1 Tax=Camelina sativa TaxID=90675 RepID=A0ABM0VN01_CAMSA|nr:PREDICTED: uncharacterized protein LOC104739863 [Camelina sativa]